MQNAFQSQLVKQVQAMIEESGRPEGFDAEAWVSRWLEELVPALGDTRPIDLIDTAEGRSLVSDTLSRMQSGTFA